MILTPILLFNDEVTESLERDLNQYARSIFYLQFSRNLYFIGVVKKSRERPCQAPVHLLCTHRLDAVRIGEPGFRIRDPLFKAEPYIW